MNKEQALTIKAGDFVRPSSFWNETERKRKLPRMACVLEVVKKQSQTGITFRVQFLNGDYGELDAGWFDYD